MGGQRQRDAVLDAVVLAADDFIEGAGDLAGVARTIGESLLVVVEFLERLHRQIDISRFLGDSQNGRNHLNNL